MQWWRLSQDPAQGPAREHLGEHSGSHPRAYRDFVVRRGAAAAEGRSAPSEQGPRCDDAPSARLGS